MGVFYKRILIGKEAYKDIYSDKTIVRIKEKAVPRFWKGNPVIQENTYIGREDNWYRYPTFERVPILVEIWLTKLMKNAN